MQVLASPSAPSGKLFGKEAKANGTITTQTVLCKHLSTSADYKETFWFYFDLLTLAVVVQTHSLPAQ